MDKISESERIGTISFLESQFVEVSKNFYKKIDPFIDKSNIIFYPNGCLLDLGKSLTEIHKNLTCGYKDFKKLANGQYQPFTDITKLKRDITGCRKLVHNEILERKAMGLDWSGKCFNQRKEDLGYKLHNIRNILENKKDIVSRHNLRQYPLNLLADELLSLEKKDNELREILPEYLTLNFNELPKEYDEAMKFGQKALTLIKQGIDNNISGD